MHLLRRRSRVKDPLLGDVDLVGAASTRFAGEPRRHCWVGAIISVAAPAEGLREAVLAMVHDYRHGKAPRSVNPSAAIDVASTDAGPLPGAGIDGRAARTKRHEHIVEVHAHGRPA